MSRETPRAPGRKAPRPPKEVPTSDRVRRRQRSAKVAVEKAGTLLEFEPPPKKIPGVMKRRLPIR